MYTEYHHFDCECHSEEHTFRFQYDTQDGDLYLSTFLNDFDPWYKRVWKATKYVFGYKCKYGHWDNTHLDLQTTKRLKDLLDKSIQLRTQQ